MWSSILFFFCFNFYIISYYLGVLIGTYPKFWYVYYFWDVLSGPDNLTPETYNYQSCDSQHSTFCKAIHPFCHRQMGLEELSPTHTDTRNCGRLRRIWSLSRGEGKKGPVPIVSETTAGKLKVVLSFWMVWWCLSVCCTYICSAFTTLGGNDSG